MAKKEKKEGVKRVEEIPKSNFIKVPTMLIVADRDIAQDFATKAYKRFEQMIKAIIMFGSSAKQEAKMESDIDLVILLDDVTIKWDEEMIATYREEISKLIEQNPYIKSLHINTVKLSTWWQDLIIGDPVVLNVVRYGDALIDHGGFFVPQKALLLAGKIRPSPEAVFNLLERTNIHLGRARMSTFAIIDAYYWACIDSAHAALMSANILPPSPEHVAEMMEENLVKTKLLNSKFVDTYTEVYQLMKEINHGDVRVVDGKRLDDIRERTEAFVVELSKLAGTLAETK